MTTSNHLDVLILGAGVSGIGLACRIAERCPEKTFAILERRNALGGTWDLFRYPGIRSDSDMFTFGYSFKPWSSSRTLADGASIKQYIADAAQSFGIDKRIIYNRKAVSSNWSDTEKRWTVVATDETTGESHQYTCNFLLFCTGYYDYDQGYKPEFPGEEQFKGRVIHPQHWPDDLNYRDKKVVVIGSGATAVTLIPAMADETAHITMLQRSPTYVLSLPAENPLIVAFQKLLPAKLAYRMARGFYIRFQRGAYDFARKYPNAARRLLLKASKRALRGQVDLQHFTPSYKPWDERLCFVQDGDLFKALRSGKASIMTDQIETFTEHGIKLQSGQDIEADIVVSATGLNVQSLGGAELKVNDVPVDLGDRVTYRHMLIDGVPNALMIFGYINASYTLRVDLAGQYLCRLLKHMDAKGYTKVVPVGGEANKSEESIGAALKSGYLMRGDAQLPRQGQSGPWFVTHNYPQDKKDLKACNLEDGHLRFESGRPQVKQGDQAPQKNERREQVTA